MGGRRGFKRIEGAQQVGCPPCAICAHGGRTPRSVRFLTHGIWMWLCDAHGSDAFMRKHGGRDFADRLGAMWVASGVFGARRRAALVAHVQRLQAAIDGQGKPGSHSWPMLRREAERRFASGEPPATVIAELRRAHRDGPARPPSVRTMRRWFSQARWMVSSPRVRSNPTAAVAFRRPVRMPLQGNGTIMPTGIAARQRE